MAEKTVGCLTSGHADVDFHHGVVRVLFTPSLVPWLRIRMLRLPSRRSGTLTRARTQCSRIEALRPPATPSHKPAGAITMRRSEFPYAVEIAGHSRGQHAMRDFHARHGMRVHLKHVKHKDGRRYIRWRFASLTNRRSLLANLLVSYAQRIYETNVTLRCYFA